MTGSHSTPRPLLNFWRSCLFSVPKRQVEILLVTMENQESNAFGLQRVALNELNPDTVNALIVGIIIGKQRPSQFTDRKSRDDEDSSQRGVWNFTFRDSLQHYINVTYWGKADFILSTSEKFHTGDVVELIRPRIFIRKINDHGENFRPMVTSPFSLTLNELSEIRRHNGSNYHTYLRLLRLPTKPLAGLVPLSIIQNWDGDSDSSVDVLAAVRSVGSSRTVKTKSRGEIELREVILFDHTCSGIKMTLWNPDLIVRSSLWKPRVTVLFLTDLVVEFSHFNHTYALKASNRTIITENPIGREAQDLGEFARTASLETNNVMEQMLNIVPDPRTINNVLTIQQLQSKLNALYNVDQTQNSKNYVTALVYAFITQLDLDGFSHIVASRCGLCKTRMKYSSSVCENSECSVAQGVDTAAAEVFFDLRIVLSDHTGSLSSCRLSNDIVESMLNCKANQFQNMTDDEKYIIKWRYLMERCVTRIVAVLNRSQPVIGVLSCALSNKSESSSRLPTY